MSLAVLQKRFCVFGRQLPCSLPRVALQMCSCKTIRKFEIVVLLARMVHASYVFIPICLLVILLLYASACILQLSQHLWNDIRALAMHILFQNNWFFNVWSASITIVHYELSFGHLAQIIAASFWLQCCEEIERCSERLWKLLVSLLVGTLFCLFRALL